MTDTTFTTSTPAADPSKHVKYLLGMVLGVEDFEQEFAYLSNRDQWLARDLVGYGTVCGLEVSYDKDNNLQVEPGAALTPSGKFIKVDTKQCAKLVDWIKDEKIQARIQGAATKVYLKLCYRECLTDPVSIAGKACLTETGDTSSLFKPSRVKDDFYLDLFFDDPKHLNLPDQTEEEALRRFVTWLSRFRITRSRSTRTTKTAARHWTADSFVDAMRGAIRKQLVERKPLLDFMEQVEQLPFASTQLDEILRSAFRVWTTEIRPLRRGGEADCVHSSQEDCVLLAELALTLESDANGGWMIKNASQHEEHRPYLLHLRMLQEWILQTSCFPGDAVVTEKGWSQSSTGGESPFFSRADHTHGTPHDPVPPHKQQLHDHDAHAVAGEVTGTIGNTSVILDGDVIKPVFGKAAKINEIQNLQGTPVLARTHSDGQVLTFVQADPNGQTMEEWTDRWQSKDLFKGDVFLHRLAESVPASFENRIAKLQGKPVNVSAPGSYDVLAFMPGSSGIKAVVEPSWRAMDLLQGDVIRSAESDSTKIINRIQSLQNKLVDAAAPEPGQVLMFVKGSAGKPDRWQPMNAPTGTPAITLAGDVSGSPSSNEIENLQSKPVSAKTPGYGQVLTFVQTYIDPDTGEEISDCWVPQASTATGQFVSRPRSEPYGIVAAGTCYFTLEPSGFKDCLMENSYNQLAVTPYKSQVNALKNGYDAELDFSLGNPPDTSPCIVKLTPWCVSQFMDASPIHSPLFTVYFIKFTYDDPATPSKVTGFKIGISSLGEIDVAKDLVDGRIMVEVSQFAADASVEPKK